MATWHESRMVLVNNDEPDRIEVWFEPMEHGEAACIGQPGAVARMSIHIGSREHELHLDEAAVNALIKDLRRVLKEAAE